MRNHDNPFQRFIVVGEKVFVSERVARWADDDPGAFQEVIDEAGADWDYEAAITASRLGYLIGEGDKRSVVYVADETLRQWAIDNGIELTFEAI